MHTQNGLGSYPYQLGSINIHTPAPAGAIRVGVPLALAPEGVPVALAPEVRGCHLPRPRGGGVSLAPEGVPSHSGAKNTCAHSEPKPTYMMLKQLKKLSKTIWKHF